jgi:hypothetical protein
VNDGAHDVPHDEADPFEALLKRAEALKNGDDVGLEALAKAVIEACQWRRDFPQKWRRKIPQSGGLAISRGRDRRLRFLTAGHDVSGSAEWDLRSRAA